MQMYQVNTKEIKSQRLEKATENDTFISIENIFKMSSIDYRNLRLDIEEVKSSFQVLINSFQRLIDNLLTHYVIKFFTKFVLYDWNHEVACIFIFTINMSDALKLKFS
jgi:tRNA(Glu) U13 pseudouridine synthase TruD